MNYLAVGIALFVGVLIGILAGILIGTDRMRKSIEEQSMGHLRIDRSEADEPPRPFLEITKGASIESIARRNFVILKVINENYLSCD